jgi:hypothetical protein
MTCSCTRYEKATFSDSPSSGLDIGPLVLGFFTLANAVVATWILHQNSKRDREFKEYQRTLDQRRFDAD